MVTKADSKSQSLLRLATTASVVVAVILISIKLMAWVMTDSISMQASLVDSMIDGLASLLNFFAIREALKPADEEHRFGHGKIEAMAAQAQSIFIAGAAVWIGFDAFHRLLHPTPLTQTSVGLWVTIITIFLTLALVTFQKYVIRISNSTIIKADHLHFKSDLFLNLSVIASLIITSYFGWWYVDPLCGLAIGAYIIWTSWRISREAFDILLDRELPDADLTAIEAIIKSHTSVRGYHDLKTRSAGPHRFIQMHLEMDGHLSLSEAHRIAHEVGDQIRNAFPQTEVLIHQDPYEGSKEGS
jgi:ferrous-iron efflux pump FieF